MSQPNSLNFPKQESPEDKLINGPAFKKLTENLAKHHKKNIDFITLQVEKEETERQKEIDTKNAYFLKENSLLAHGVFFEKLNGIKNISGDVDPQIFKLIQTNIDNNFRFSRLINKVKTDKYIEKTILYLVNYINNMDVSVSGKASHLTSIILTISDLIGKVNDLEFLDQLPGIEQNNDYDINESIQKRISELKKTN